MNAIEVVDVSKRFGDFVAVDGVSLAVAPGEVVGLVGANGAGKTTLIRMILGVLAASSGAVRLLGRPPTRDQRRRVGYVPQSLGLYRDLTASENLEFLAGVFGLDAAARPATDVDALVAELPLGVQRRIAFAAATQHHPEILILDEPTSGVSALERSRLWNLIRAEAEDEGAAVLVTTHYMDEAEQADRIELMSHGRIVARGALEDIIGSTTAVEVVTDDWQRAFEILDDAGMAVTLSGRTIRVVGRDPGEVEPMVSLDGARPVVRTVPATLEETMVLLER